LRSTGAWHFDEGRRLRCQVLENVDAWGQTAVRVWYPEAETVLLVSPQQLRPVEDLRTSPQEIAYITAAAKVVDALDENTLLAPIESAVIPLPHQILALLKAVSSDRVRLLLADEVGLGKTIEAGLIIKELKLRGLIRRVLVVAPKGLVIPQAFVDRLVHVLHQNGRFANWPLTELLTDRSLFYAFLHERWPKFLSRLSNVAEPGDGPLNVDGPADLPFDNPDVRVYIDNLFLEPVEWAGIPKGWVAAGVRHDPRQDSDRRFAALLDVAEREMPGSDARHGDWLSFARIWRKSIY
jgi:hypothetical protein